MSVNYVPVPVREEYVPRVIALLADLDRGIAVDGATAQVEADGPKVVLDSNVVIRMYMDSETRHRELLEYLASRAGEWVYTSEIAEALGVTTGSKGMAGVFGAFGRRAKHRYEGAKPWELAWEPTRGEARYRVDPEVAVWIKEGAAKLGG